MVMGNIGCLMHGATMVYPAEAFEPGAVLQAVQDEKCTGLYGVPTMFIAELGAPDFGSFDLSSLRTGCMAESPSPVSFQPGKADPLERRASTIGQVQPHLECKVIDPDGNTVPRGETGELCTRGYPVMLGYWDGKEKTADAIDAEGRIAH